MARSAAAKRAIPKPSPSSTSSALPPPFESAPEHMIPFLESLPPKHIYITHMDTHPIGFKQQIFAIPVVLNFTIALLLVWRVYAAVPWYLAIAQELWDRPNAPFIGAGGWKAMALTAAWRMATFAFDYALAVVVVPWPYTFFLAYPSSPTLWRFKIGFQTRELVVRKSRGWGAVDLFCGEKTGAENAFWKTRVETAVGLEKVGKTGYLLTDESWDLEFGAMGRGQKLLKEGEMKEEDVNGKVWGYIPQRGNRAGEWVMWDFRRDLYPKQNAGSAGSGMDQTASTAANSEQARTMILRFRDKLVEMGKEELFFKWVECIQYESSQPGGFTPERQAQAGERVKALFEQNGVDFEKFGRDVGMTTELAVDQVD
jgi:hypothetical protein